MVDRGGTCHGVVNLVPAGNQIVNLFFGGEAYSFGDCGGFGEEKAL